MTDTKVAKMPFVLFVKLWFYDLLIFFVKMVI